MDSRAILGILEQVLETSKIAILATVDSDGCPHMRWMTPGLVRGREGYLYAVTSPEFAKARDVAGQPRVQWMIQSKGLDRVVTACGTMTLLDNPSVKAEVLESIGGHLGTFWKMNTDPQKIVVLETRLERVSYLNAISGERRSVELGASNG